MQINRAHMLLYIVWHQSSVNDYEIMTKLSPKTQPEYFVNSIIAVNGNLTELN